MIGREQIKSVGTPWVPVVESGSRESCCQGIAYLVPALPSACWPGWEGALFSAEGLISGILQVENSFCPLAGTPAAGTARPGGAAEASHVGAPNPIDDRGDLPAVAIGDPPRDLAGRVAADPSDIGRKPAWAADGAPGTCNAGRPRLDLASLGGLVGNLSGEIPITERMECRRAGEN